MSTYRGPAVLITDDGAEFGVGANLSSRRDGRESWGGSLTIDGRHWRTIANKDQGFQLRLPTGNAGKFLRPNPSEMPPAPGQSFVITILGDDDAPF